MKKRYRIGIITFHRAINYGAFLQAYGLVKRLNEEPDIEAEIIDFNMEVEDNHYAKMYCGLRWNLKHFYRGFHKRKLVREFQDALRELPMSKPHIMSDSIDDFREYAKDKYDVIISGSDELWKLDGMRGFPTPYWLPGDFGCVKASYAVSSRNNFDQFPEDTRKKIKEFLSSYSIVSVRDALTYDQVLNYSNPEKLLLSGDPSMIYDYSVNPERGKEILRSVLKTTSKARTGILITDDSDKREVAKTVRTALGNDYALISTFCPYHGYNNIAVDPFDWVNIISAADIIITSLFHGVCFSIVCGKPFVVLESKYKREKVNDLLSATGFQDRLIPAEKENDSQFIRNQAIRIYGENRKTNYPDTAKREFDLYLAALRKVLKNRSSLEM